MLIIRKANPKDAGALYELYSEHLASNPPTQTQCLDKWREHIQKFESDGLYHLLVGSVDGRIVSSVTLVVIENLTNNSRPYAIIENVVTHAGHRGKGYATALMKRAVSIAEEAGCYKIMLMTGSKKESTLGFYSNCGFDMKEKTAFIMRL
jgi:GNAT superfamily N-acetyltransferase